MTGIRTHPLNHPSMTLYLISIYILNSLTLLLLFWACSSLYEWSVVMPLSSPLKQAAGYVLCAICHVHPALYITMLSWMGIINKEEEMEMDELLTGQCSGSKVILESQNLSKTVDQSMRLLLLKGTGHLW